MAPSDTRPLATLYLSLLLSTGLVVLLVALTFWLGARERTEMVWVRHTLAVRNQLSGLATLVISAETGQRGYLLTGDTAYLEPYERAVTDLATALDETATLVADNPKQQQSIGQLRQLVDDKLRELRSTVEDYKAGDKNAALAIVTTGEGRRIMGAIRDLLKTMQAEEDRLLTTRQQNAAQLGQWLQIGAAIDFFSICVVAVLVVVVTRRSFAQIAAARDQLIVTNRDLTEQVGRREEAESQLRQSQKMEAVGQLTGGIAHDFNNMLAVVSGSLELMQRRLKKGDLGIERFLDAALKACDRAATLTQRLLAFARQQPLAPRPVDANRMIADMSELLRSTLGEHIHIETVLAAGLWATHADVNQLENTILNVAINARDAMPDGGNLTIETANAYLDDAYCRRNAEVQPGQFVMIAITDTGGGMPPNVLARAFDPFFTTKPTGKGTGLGLSQVYGFIKQSRGHIKIYSEVGAGTTVRIYLPRLMGATEQIRPPAAIPTQVARDGEVILVVEDDQLMRRLTTEALRELGYTVLDCDHAIAALAILERRTDVMLLFTDVVMPDVNGKTLADDAVRLHPGLKVLFTTGYTANAVVHGGVLDPGVQLLSKPFTLDQLAAKIRNVLDA